MVKRIQRGIQSSGKRKVELVELCEKSEEMKVPKIAEEEAPVDPRVSMKEQLKTDEGDLANPLDNENRVFSQWTKNFTNVPDFRFPDLFNYLVGKDPVYNSESLKSYKSLYDLLRCKLLFDGHAETIKVILSLL